MKQNELIKDIDSIKKDLNDAVRAYYSQSMRDSILRGIEKRVKSGEFISSPPYGYEHNSSRNGVNIKKAKTVYDIFRTYLNGDLTISMLAETINRKHGTNLSRQAIKKILGNEAYIGLIYLKSTDQKYEHKYRSLIDKDVFKQVQDKLSLNTK